MQTRRMFAGYFLAGLRSIAQPKPKPDPRENADWLLSFTLEETGPDVIRKMGHPTQVGDMGAYVTWQYQINVEDLHEFSHILCFRKLDGKLVSITRNSEEGERIDSLFPASQTTPHYWPNREKPQYGVRVRRLKGNRLFIAMGAPEMGQETKQTLLIRRDAVRFFFDWLEPQLDRQKDVQASSSLTRLP